MKGQRIRVSLPLLALTLGAAPLGRADAPPTETPAFRQSDLEVRFDLDHGHLRQRSFRPASAGDQPPLPRPTHADTGVEVELQATGRNWNEHHAAKLIGGEPGTQLVYAGRQSEKTPGGIHEVLVQTSPPDGLRVESHYLFFDGIPVVRRWTRVENRGTAPIGLDHVSSAMLYGLANPGQRPLEDKLRLHLASNSWECEGQWQTASPAVLGYVDNGNFNLNAIARGNLGSWSSMSYLPLAMAENRDAQVIWFWQIEHDGAWHWELSDTPDRTSYLYLGGPDETFSGAWKQLRPGASYSTVPVAVGCVRGGFDEAVAALTRYRRAACLSPTEDNARCPVIFNDYMNCLKGDPTAEKEAPLIAAAAKAGCDYFVIDAGWYAEVGENWWETVGTWEPSKTRWGEGGLLRVLDSIRTHGMVPGLWLEIEVAGIHSPLKDKPDSWFMMRHGERVIDNGRYLLDFRNPEVRAYADAVVDRVAGAYGVGYLKIDYNVDALLGTDQGADSPGQGLLEHQRAYLAWLDGVRTRFPRLVIENCGSGGGRMDYALLSRTQVQSSSDQTDYRKYPSIVAGALAAVLPEQLGVWSYPKTGDDADAASFNLVNAMLARIQQSGNLAELRPASWREVCEGIRVYKEHIQPELPRMTPYYPLGLPSMADPRSPVAVGLRGAQRSLIAVWRLNGEARVRIPTGRAQAVTLLYPRDLGIVSRRLPSSVELQFPRPYMAALLEVRP
jgi:alpha-galactosidase